MKRSEAKAAGEMFFTGRACPKHPELGGLRRTKSGICPDCQRERVRERQQANREELAAYHREWRRKVKTGEHAPRKYRKARP